MGRVHRRTSSVVRPSPLILNPARGSAVSVSADPSSSSSSTMSSYSHHHHHLPPIPHTPVPSTPMMPMPTPSFESTSAALFPLSLISGKSPSKSLFVQKLSAPLRAGRKLRLRLAVLSLFALMSVSVYLCFFSLHSTFSRQAHRAPAQIDFAHLKPQSNIVSPQNQKSSPQQQQQQPPSSPYYSSSSTQYPPLKLTPEQELAAISAHLASLPQNVIPHHVDPSRPIDPQLVLDFDVTSGKRAEEEVKMMVSQAWEQNPVLVYCKRYSPQTRELKSILALMDIYPPPTIFDLDARPDHDVLIPLISRLALEVSPSSSSSSSDALPFLLIGGKPVAVADVAPVAVLHESGELQTMILQSGAIIREPKKKKGRGRV